MAQAPTHVAVWDGLSSIYDRQLRLERRALEAALDLARPGVDDVLLDAGTGTGAVLRALAARGDRPRTAVGVDASKAMLAHVPRLPDGWWVRHAELEALPLEDATFDVALAAYLLHVLCPSTRAPTCSRPALASCGLAPCAPGTTRCACRHACPPPPERRERRWT